MIRAESSLSFQREPGPMMSNRKDKEAGAPGDYSYPMSSERIGPNAGGLKLEPSPPPEYTVQKGATAGEIASPPTAVIDPFSVTCLYLKLYANDQLVSTATGF